MSTILQRCALNGDCQHNEPVKGVTAEGQTGPVSPRRLARDQATLARFSTDLTRPLIGAPQRVENIWHFSPNGCCFTPITLTLYTNGILVERSDTVAPISVSWSPFTIVQAVRLNTVKADAALPTLRLFKIIIINHKWSDYFATRGDDADSQRARWVADISRCLRVMTQSYFPDFQFSVDPVLTARWTLTRLLAGYLIIPEERGSISLMYCELHSHFNATAVFVGYEDEDCTTVVLQLPVQPSTIITENVGVDCSCFSIDKSFFTARSCAEKLLWLRAIGNVKTKLRYRAPNPNVKDLENFRAAILEQAELSAPHVEKEARAYWV